MLEPGRLPFPIELRNKLLLPQRSILHLQHDKDLSSDCLCKGSKVANPSEVEKDKRNLDQTNGQRALGQHVQQHSVPGRVLQETAKELGLEWLAGP